MRVSRPFIGDEVSASVKVSVSTRPLKVEEFAPVGSWVAAVPEGEPAATPSTVDPTARSLFSSSFV
jgi:hypothetical protein